ncbi:unnamed protein product [Cuscuta europaea]|uniref:Uncharacterized protein n=1 Tax=Cuscuta europaea TaxID=41803 RepID=A0A9P0ZZP9_CUSEU|nr:unnamed protein product [Cuscuta europaea]
MQVPSTVQGPLELATEASTDLRPISSAAQLLLGGSGTMDLCPPQKSTPTPTPQSTPSPANRDRHLQNTGYVDRFSPLAQEDVTSNPLLHSQISSHGFLNNGSREIQKIKSRPAIGKSTNLKDERLLMPGLICPSIPGREVTKKVWSSENRGLSSQGGIG